MAFRVDIVKIYFCHLSRVRNISDTCPFRKRAVFREREGRDEHIAPRTLTRFGEQTRVIPHSQAGAIGKNREG
jgi:hypothetical protein